MGKEDGRSNESIAEESQYTLDSVDGLEEELPGDVGGNLERGSEGGCAGEPRTQALRPEEETGKGTPERGDFVEASGQDTDAHNTSSHVAVGDGSSDETHHSGTDGEKLTRDSQTAEVDEDVGEGRIVSDIEVHPEAQDAEGDYEEEGVWEGKDAASPHDIPNIEARDRAETRASAPMESALGEETAEKVFTLEYFGSEVDPSSPNASANLLDEEGNYIFEQDATQFEEYDL
uniref:Uncharacterized protein n=1 Tax=Rhodosorus marinus TaxID=101924 RepID=A0A7S0G2N2_9RHOD